MKELTFKSTKITPIIINGQPYLGVSQIAMALQYKRGGQIDTPFAEESVRRLYNRHSDEFTPDMTFLTEQDTAGGKQQIRVFSLRGCHLLAMFSKTPVAKEFRKWCLDILEGKIILPFGQSAAPDKPVTVAEHQRSLPSGKKEIVLSEKAKQEIGGIVKAVMQANERPAAPVRDESVLKAINLLSARMENMARFMSMGNTSAAQW